MKIQIEEEKKFFDTSIVKLLKMLRCNFLSIEKGLNSAMSYIQMFELE